MNPPTVPSYYKENKDKILANQKQDRLTRREKDLKEAKIPIFLTPYAKVNKRTISLVVTDLEQLEELWKLFYENYEGYIASKNQVADDDKAK